MRGTLQFLVHLRLLGLGDIFFPKSESKHGNTSEDHGTFSLAQAPDALRKGSLIPNLSISS